MNYKQLSKTISHALRHKPWLYELELDPEGFVSVESLLSVLRNKRTEWQGLELVHLEAMISRSDKRRFEIVDQHIRALYGHSVPQKIKKVESQPPEILYHGTSPRLVELILREGLKPMNRHHVHLSTNEVIAKEVGLRKSSKPHILTIKAMQAYEEGVKFYTGNNKIWLSDMIPAKYINRD